MLIFAIKFISLTCLGINCLIFAIKHYWILLQVSSMLGFLYLIASSAINVYSNRNSPPGNKIKIKLSLGKKRQSKKRVNRDRDLDLRVDETSKRSFPLILGVFKKGVMNSIKHLNRDNLMLEDRVEQTDEQRK